MLGPCCYPSYIYPFVSANLKLPIYPSPAPPPRFGNHESIEVPFQVLPLDLERPWKRRQGIPGQREAMGLSKSWEEARGQTGTWAEGEGKGSMRLAGFLGAPALSQVSATQKPEGVVAVLRLGS